MSSIAMIIHISQQITAIDAKIMSMRCAWEIIDGGEGEAARVSPTQRHLPTAIDAFSLEHEQRQIVQIDTTTIVMITFMVQIQFHVSLMLATLGIVADDR
jgi:hypothetical protein